MITCGIDIGKGKRAAALDESGWEIGLAKFYDNTRQGAEKLLERLRRHSDLASVRIGMESTGNYWRAFYDRLTKAGCRVDVINPIVTKASSAGDIRGRKTDTRDARVIADVVLRDNHVARPAENGSERGLKGLTRQRGFLVGECTAAKLHVLDSLSETSRSSIRSSMRSSGASPSQFWRSPSTCALAGVVREVYASQQ